MKRIHAAALAAALVAAGAASGQQPPAKPDVMTLTSQDGKAAHTYKVIRTYKHPSGGTASEVRDETTGEVMTVVENAIPDDVKASLKMEPFGSAKPAKASEPVKKQTESVKQAEPTSNPVAGRPAEPLSTQKTLGGPVAQQKAEPKPETQYTRPPVPAVRRWLNWPRPTPEAKPVPTPVSKGRMPVDQGEVLSVYHPDPIIRLIGAMTDDFLPSMREVSAEALVRYGNGRPDVVEALMRSAKTDLAPSVRACCCRCLAEMKVNSPECVTALKGLEDDKEPSVRTAAAAARAMLEQP